jgi:membrane protein
MKPLQRFWDLVVSGEIQVVAGALAFSTILSLIPFMAVSLATLQYIGGLEAIYPKVEALALQYFQGPTGAEGTQIIRKVFKRIHAGKMGGWGAIALVLASTFLINDMERGLHRIWNLPTRRPVHKRIFLYWLFMILFPAALAIYVAISSLKVFEGTSSAFATRSLNNTLLFLTLYFLYKVVPNTKVSIGAALVGAITGTLGLIVLFASFKWISQSFFAWGKLYGSFAAIPTLLIWVLLTWYMVLVGAAVSASFRR